MVGKDLAGKRKRRKGAAGQAAAWRTLGFIGAGRGTGVTHLTIWTANYLTGIRREKTAILEWNDHGDWERLGRFCQARARAKGPDDAGIGKRRAKAQTGPDFQILESDYYAGAGAGTLAECLNRPYRRILIDFGEMNREQLAECARCDRQVIVGALSEWQGEACLEAAGAAAELGESWRYAAAFGSEETRRELEKAFRIPCLRIPFCRDVFAVTPGQGEFFEGLLSE
ncbi:MAG TPA: hypothetical protein IAC37_00275 [Candidatus Ventrimonas merdavium]|nr:hypothetical protein [Candidatus Ventrimonas merdavium]